MVLPRTGLHAALAFARSVARALRSQTIADRSLRATFGIALATSADASPDDVVHRADLEQIRAKQESKQHAPRPSVMAWGGDQIERLDAELAP